MSEQFELMIPGGSGTGEMLKVVAPWGLSEIAEVPVVSASDVDLALNTAYKIFRDRDRWLPVPKRIEVLEKTAELMQQQAEHLAMEAAREGGLEF